MSFESNVAGGCHDEFSERMAGKLWARQGFFVVQSEIPLESHTGRRQIYEEDEFLL